MEFQHTIQQAISLSGKGLHTGKPVTLTFYPAPPQHGYCFRRDDLPDQPIIKADIDYVGETERSTTLEYKNVKVRTVEHVLAALVGLGIDNVLIALDNEEVPIMDGSAMPFVEALQNAGIETQNAPRDYFVFTETFYFRDEEKDAEYIVIPADELHLTTMIDYGSTLLGKQFATLTQINDFVTQIASARTFCFLHELETLLDHNLIKGGDLDNALVIADKPISDNSLERLAQLFNKPNVAINTRGYLNHTELHYDNEPARHKLLDVLGDMALVGTPVKARIIANKPGHAGNTAFARQLKAHIKKQRSLQNVPKYDVNLPSLYDIKKIMQSLPHRFPFLLIDKIIELSEQHVVGIKNVTMNEAFFQGHFPGHPIMPGVMIIEAMAQIGGILMFHALENPSQYVTYFLRIDQAKFRHPVVPGDTLILKLQLNNPTRRGICEMSSWAYVGNRLVAEASFVAQIIKR